MSRLAGRVIFVGLLVAAASVAAGRTQDWSRGLVAHEWGTFTTVAGQDGTALQWLPLGGPTDLPCFVTRFKNNGLFKYALGSAPLTYDQARAGLRGTVRMETPVIYFYASRETDVDVAVRFPQGLMTEWYPQAAVTQPTAFADVLSKGGQSLIAWNGVRIRPGRTPTLPDEGKPSHYYAARETDAAPVQVKEQDEKFLFYRGVGGFQVPLSAVLTASGRIHVVNLGRDTIPAVVLFEKRGGRIGYRIHGALRTEATFDRPALKNNLASLGTELEQVLMATGLYAREARAMVQTWRDSWFEDGVRLFYLVPGAAVDAILPLTITPTPAEVVRAFVGRVEVITPETIREVRDAIAEADDEALAPYGRFLGPIADRISASMTPAERARTSAALQNAFDDYIKRTVSYCK